MCDGFIDMINGIDVIFVLLIEISVMLEVINLMNIYIGGVDDDGEGVDINSVFVMIFGDLVVVCG